MSLRPFWHSTVDIQFIRKGNVTATCSAMCICVCVMIARLLPAGRDVASGTPAELQLRYEHKAQRRVSFYDVCSHSRKLLMVRGSPPPTFWTVGLAILLSLSTFCRMSRPRNATYVHSITVSHGSATLL